MKNRDFINIEDFTSKELTGLIKLAVSLKSKKNLDILSGKNLVMYFSKPSLRTRLSFEIGMAKLGGGSYVIKQDEIILGKRESIEDTARVISKYADAVTIRTFAHADVEKFAEFSNIPVINALTDLSHPCQVMADLLTVYEIFGGFQGLKLVYTGDGNNIANSLLTGCASFGINMTAAIPEGFEPDKNQILKAKKIAEKTGAKIEIVNDPYEAVNGANIVYTDVWTSMGQEDDADNRKEVFKNYQLNDKLMENADKNGIILHCLPAHKGEEIARDTFEKHADTIFKQAENRIYAQMAILASIM